MHELTLVHDLRPDVALPGPDTLAQSRATLMADIRRVPSQGRDRAAGRRFGRSLHHSVRRVVIRRVVIGGLAAAAAVTAIAVALPSGHHGIGPATADAVTVLHQAATAALTVPDTVPQPGQFYYVRTPLPGGPGYSGAPGHSGAPGYEEQWRSIDGIHDGGTSTNGGPVSTVGGCRDGQHLVAGNYTGLKKQPCTPDPAYISDAPTTTAAMTAYLNATFGPGTNSIAKGVATLLGYTDYLRPAARAAVYDALASIPDLHAAAAPAAGPDVVAISWSVTGPNNEPSQGQTSASLLFNQRTHAYVGLTTTGIKGEPGSALVPDEIGIVDNVGQRP